MAYKSNLFYWLAGAVMLILSGCISYGFTGTSVPEGVNTIFIPFFANQTSSGVPDLSDKLNNVLIERFINQSSLTLTNNRVSADAILEGSIVQYTNEPFSITGQNQAEQNQVTIVVQASYRYPSKEKEVYNQRFSGSATYNPTQNPIEDEAKAAQEALEQIANNMFNSAVSGW